MSVESGDVVLVPVPRRFLAEVYRLLGDLMTPALPAMDDTAGSEPGGDDGGQPDVPWSEEDLTRLASRLRERDLRAVLAMLDLAAVEPGKRILFSEIVDVTGLSNGKARQELAQLTWILRDEFGRTNWPVHVRYTGSGRALYSFDDRNLAMAWRSANSS